MTLGTQVGVPYLEVDWHLTNRCNFYCEYCHPQIRRVLNVRNLTEPTPDACCEAFDRLKAPCHISMSGGEPFLFPGFVDLCHGLTKRHVISINTNLSSPLIAEFAERIQPERVTRIAAALHIEERERLKELEEDFVHAYQLLRSKGFPIFGLYVLYPPMIPRCGVDIERLREKGVDRIAGKVFKGGWNGKNYPDAYTPEERKQIEKVTGEYPYNEAYLNGMFRFKGQECFAGNRSLKVLVTGEVRRCASVVGSLGNLYDGTVELTGGSGPCTANRALVVSQCLANLASPPMVQPVSREMTSVSSESLEST